MRSAGSRSSRSPSPSRAGRRWATSRSATSTTSAPARSGSAEQGRGAPLNGRPLAGPGAEGSDRDPLVRGDHDRFHRRKGRGDARRRRAPTGDGLAGAVALPSRGRPGRRGVLAQAGQFDRHRGGPAPRAGVRLRDRTLRGATLHGGPSRSHRALARRCSCEPGALRGACCGAYGNAEGAAFAAPSCSGRWSAGWTLPAACLPSSAEGSGLAWPGHASPVSQALAVQLAAGALLLNAGAFASFAAPAPRTISARMMKPMPLSSRAIPTMTPNSAICSAM